MKQKYVPLDKRSKKKQKEYNDMQRRGWGEFNPISRKTTNQKVYNRKKSERWHEYGPGSDFFMPVGNCLQFPLASVAKAATPLFTPVGNCFT